MVEEERGDVIPKKFRAIKLPRRVRDFVRLYDGDSVKSMLGAGYEGAPQYLEQKAKEILQDPRVQKALEYRGLMDSEVNQKVADRKERQAFWSSLLRNEDPYAKPEVDKNGNFIPADKIAIPLNMRMKAAELLGKSEGDFVEKVEINSTVTLESEILKSYNIGASVEDIEAEYRHIKEVKKIEAPGETVDASSDDDTVETSEGGSVDSVSFGGLF